MQSCVKLKKSQSRDFRFMNHLIIFIPATLSTCFITRKLFSQIKKTEKKKKKVLVNYFRNRKLKYMLCQFSWKILSKLSLTENRKNFDSYTKMFAMVAHLLILFINISDAKRLYPIYNIGFFRKIAFLNQLLYPK